MSVFPVRTDLALEAREFVEEADKKLHGVIVEESTDEESDVHITKVQITSKNGAKAIGKPMGTYITLEAPHLDDADDDYHSEVSEVMARYMKELLPKTQKEKSILMVGLGNRDVTADALGPMVADNLFITRHMLEQFGKAAYEGENVPKISAIVPGVMGKTGMESVEIVKGIVAQTAPDVIVVVDALAARSTKRLNRTIQITNTGIHPGSGVGNHREAINEECLGIPVIAIGVPTVVDAATIIRDVGKMDIAPGEISHGEMNNMYVTSKDIDAIVKRLSYTLSEGLNMAFAGE